MIDEWDYDDWDKEQDRAYKREEIEMLIRKLIERAMENNDFKKRKLNDELKFFNSFSYDYIAEWAESSPLVVDFFIAEHHKQFKDFKILLTELVMNDI